MKKLGFFVRVLLLLGCLFSDAAATAALAGAARRPMSIRSKNKCWKLIGSIHTFAQSLSHRDTRGCINSRLFRLRRYITTINTPSPAPALTLPPSSSSFLSGNGRAERTIVAFRSRTKTDGVTADEHRGLPMASARRCRRPVLDCR